MRDLLPFLFITALVSCSSGTETAVEANPTITNLAGKSFKPLELDEDKLRVLVFVTHDCPIANSYAPEINRIVDEYEPRGIDFALVHVDPEISNQLLIEHARDHEIVTEILVDPDHRLVSTLGAEVTPEAFVIQGSEGGYALRYRGRIDDRNVAFGKKRVVPGRHDLRLTLDVLLAGGLPEVSRTQAVGCYIE